MENIKIDYHTFVDNKLAENGLKIVRITEDLMVNRLDDFFNFVNGIRKEYESVYGWKQESREYFLNPLDNKWKYSFVVMNNKEDLCFVNFSSVYGKIIHNHCTYARKENRNLNIAKLHNIKLCQTGIDNGFTRQEGYWPKNNNGSIILFLKMGWKIENIRNNDDLFMTADLEKVRNQTYYLVLNGK